MRRVRAALVYAVRDCRARLIHRTAFDQAATRERYCPTDRLLVMLRDARHAGAPRDDLLAVADTIRGEIEAMYLPGHATPIVDVLLSEQRDQNVSDYHERELMARPECLTTMQRAIASMERHARKLFDAAAAIRTKLDRARANGGQAA